MRITNSSMLVSHMYDVQETLQRMDKLNNQLDTGKQVNRVSDDPHKAIKIMNLNNEIKYTEKYNYNIDEIVGWMNNTDSSLEEVGRALNDIKDSILKVGNGAYTEEEFKAINADVNVKIRELGETLNSSYAGRHMFGGSNVDEAPVNIKENADGTVTLELNSKANSDDLKADISDGINIDYNVSVEEIFDTGKGGKDYLSAINDVSKLLNDISNGKDVEVNKEKLTGDVKVKIDSFFNNALDNRTKLGVRVSTAENIKNLNNEHILNMKGVLSADQDINHVEKFSELKSVELVYNASIQAGLKLIQPSILDYLR